MQDPDSHSEHTRRDTQRANERTFKRRSFMAPPRSEIEAEMEKETYHHKGIANEHFVDDIPQEESGLPDGFNEETLNVVEDDNTAGQRIFLTKTKSV